MTKEKNQTEPSSSKIPFFGLVPPETSAKPGRDWASRLLNLTSTPKGNLPRQAAFSLKYLSNIL